ncbi:MAG: nucleoside triphosphate pyrophosphohydrolase [Minisyncoccota bacterium]
MRYQKLVRDKIPEIIAAKGEKVLVHTATGEEYWEKLKEKLVEEAQEFSKEPVREELADILEVVHAIMTHQGWSFEEVEVVRHEKAKKRGKFEKKLILDES